MTAACEVPNVGTGIRHGVILVDAIQLPDASIGQVPWATFIKNSKLTPDFFARDTCVALRVGGDMWNAIPRDRDLSLLVGGIYANSLLAGDVLRMASAGRVDSLSPTIGAAGFEYDLSLLAAVPVAPGAQVTWEILGASGEFPNATITTRLAEPIAIDTSSSTESQITFTWTPAPTSGSRALTSLRFRSADDVLAPTIDVACSFPDTGTAVLPEGLLAAYRRSPVPGRVFTFSRARFDVEVLGPKTSVHVVSSYRSNRPRL